jgi:alpha-L-arabinofuranosidase
MNNETGRAASCLSVFARRDGSVTITIRATLQQDLSGGDLAMTVLTRRTFLSRIGATGTLAAAAPWLLPVGYTQTARGPAHAFLRGMPGRVDFDRRLLGSFLEHLGRAVYTGVYAPGSRHADAKGFRTDVAREVKALGVPMVRYPGGNFVSGYNWLDGVGPKAQRPTVLERAWNSIESNQFGTNEFVEWCGMVGAEPLLGMNFGTGSVEMAIAYVEYCNLDRGTRWSELRRAHGYDRPHNVRYWCLGNEMDGPWQIGQLQAREYGRKARDAAKQMRVIDPELRLIACGSSGTFMPTYLTWDREVLEECYDQVDGISLHAYYGNTKEWSGNSTARFLAMNLDMDRHIHEVAAVCDYVQGLQKSSKRLWLSFDEWNVWYRARDANATDGKRGAAPPLLEEVYNLEDALLVGGFLNTLLRNSDRVRVGCLAQLVNVIAPLVTNDSGVLRQSTYYPYNWALRYARGRVLDLRVESETYPIKAAGLQADFAREGTVPFVDLVATIDDAAHQAAVLVLNRDLEGERELVLEWEDVVPTRVLACETLTGADLKAVNTFDNPGRVVPQKLEPPAAGRRMTFKLPPRSYTVVHLATNGGR